jgi:hypothetical protein
MRLARHYRADFVDESPEAHEMDRFTLYIVGSPGAPFCAAMLCPCGCGEALYMSLVEDDEPRWRVKVYEDGTPTMVPSISRVVGCRSHFFLFWGRVRWVRTRSRPTFGF